MPQRKQVTWSDLRVGLLVLAGLLLIAVTIFYVTGAGGVLAPKYRLNTYLPEVEGLKVGAPVRLDGVEIGNVDAIVMARRPREGKLERKRSVQVVMRINKNFRDEIRDDSTARLVTEGLLGNRYVSIARGVTGKPIPENGVVPGTEEAAIKLIVERGAEVVENLNAISSQFRAILDGIDRGQGTIGKLIHDEELYRHANSVLTRGDEIFSSVQEGRGTVGKLVASDELYQKVNSGATRLDTLLADVQAQKGTLGRLVYDSTIHEDAKRFLDRGNRMIADVEAGKGTLGKLVTDDALYNKVRDAAANVDKATAKLNDNTGTAGKFFSDPQFYDNMTGLAGDMRLLVGDFRKNPRKFLRVKFALF